MAIDLALVWLGRTRVASVAIGPRSVGANEAFKRGRKRTKAGEAGMCLLAFLIRHQLLAYLSPLAAGLSLQMLALFACADSRFALGICSLLRLESRRVQVCAPEDPEALVQAPLAPAPSLNPRSMHNSIIGLT